MWRTPFNAALYATIQPSRPVHQEVIIDNDYFDDEELDDVLNDEEFNPDFIINQTLLNERVYPVCSACILSL